MSHRRHPICPSTGKVRYREPRDAKFALRHAERDRSRARLNEKACSHHEIDSYNCSDCDGWHLTSRPARPVQLVPLAMLKPANPGPAARAIQRMATATGLAAGVTAGAAA